MQSLQIEAMVDKYDKCINSRVLLYVKEMLSDHYIWVDT